MSDILKRIHSPASVRNDPNGNLFGAIPWSEHEAIERAVEIGITMNDNQWDIVLFVRDYYRGRGDEASAREVMKALGEEFAGDGGRKWLYQCFPGGPVNQASFIAGIPIPSGASDPSFGSRL
jgi:tRNA 2-thiouridine synthesizing protein E